MAHGLITKNKGLVKDIQLLIIFIFRFIWKKSVVWIVTVLKLAWSARSTAWQSVSSARTAECPVSTGAVAMNDLQETVWSSSHL